MRVTVDGAPAGWQGRGGFVTTLIERTEVEPANTVAFVCSPELMMRYTALALGERGVPGDATYVSLERSMSCGLGHCGHCQLGAVFICLDGPVFPWTAVEPLLRVREL